MSTSLDRGGTAASSSMHGGNDCPDQRHGRRLRTLTLDLETFISVLCSSDRDRQFDLQLYILPVALAREINHRHQSGRPDRAVRICHEAMQLYPSNHPYHSIMRSNHAVAVFRQLEASTSDLDINESIAAFRALLQDMSPSHPNRVETAFALAKYLKSRFEQQQTVDDLEGAVANFELALEICPSSRKAERAEILYGFAATLFFRFKLFEDMADLDPMIDSLRQCRILLPPDHPQYLECTIRLFRALHHRLLKSPLTADIDETSQLQVEVVTNVPVGHASRLLFLAECGANFVSYYERTGRIPHINLAITYLGEVEPQLQNGEHVETIGDRSSMLILLGTAHLARWDVLGGADDIEKFTRYLQEALELCPLGSPNLTVCLDLLSGNPYEGPLHAKNHQDLLDLITRNYDAAVNLPTAAFNASHFLSLSNCLMRRFKLEMRPSDINEAISYAKMAVELAQSDRALLRRAHLSLAYNLHQRYNERRDIVDLDEAIKNCRAGSSPLSPLAVQRSVDLIKLSTMLHSRYEMLEDPADLKESGDCLAQAHENLPPDHQEYSSLLTNMARLKLEISGLTITSTGDSSNAIPLLQQALDLSPSANSLRNIANAILIRGTDMKSLEDLNRGVQLMRDILDQSNSPGDLYNLGCALHGRFAIQGVASDLEETISLFLQVEADQRESRNIRARVAVALSKAYEDKFRVYGNLADFEEALVYYEKAANGVSLPQKVRFTAAANWANVARQMDHKSTLRAYITTLPLLDRYVMGSHTIETQHERLSAVDQVFPLNAASWAISEGHLEAAIELLEQGRAILWSEVGRYRTPLVRLKQEKPALAEQLDRLNRLLDQNLVSSANTDSHDGATYRSLASQWNSVVEHIRSEDGFSDFLKSTPFATLQQAAKKGPVIVINIDVCRSDAIIIQTSSSPILVPIPNATPEEMTSLSADLVTALQLQGDTDIKNAKQAKITSVLRHIWELVMEPIVKELQENLGISEKSRIWLCPTSTLWSLPLHAAGPYKRGKRNLPDIFTCSYTPTLSALISSFDKARREAAPPTLLLVGQGRTPGQRPLPSVAEEVQKVKNLVSSTVLLKDEEATHEAVLCGLQQCSWVHFACHGQQDSVRPFNSRFILHDETLRLLDIIQTGVPTAEFAFLSACHSAAGDRRTPNEAIHLASGLQFSGFGGVVGTMWAMADLDGPVVAEEFYRYMFRGPGVADYQDAAVALNLAVKSLRRDNVPLERWINFIHIGG